MCFWAYADRESSDQPATGTFLLEVAKGNVKMFHVTSIIDLGACNLIVYAEQFCFIWVLNHIHNLSVILRWCLAVTVSSMLTFRGVPH